jgi:HEAT repeat protein
VAALLSGEAASGAAPAVLLETTIQAALWSAAGEAGAASLSSARAALLAKGVLRTMLLTRLKVAAGLLLVVGVVSVGAGLFAQGVLTAGRAGPSAEAAPDDLPGAGKEDDLRKDVQRLTDELHKMQEKVSALENRLGSPEASAAPVLYQAKPAEYWIRSLKDRDPSYRVTAVKALGAIAEEDPRMISIVAGALKDRDVEVRQAAAVALGGLGPAAQPAVPALVEALKAGEHDPSANAAENALYDIGPGTVPALAKVLQDPSKDAPRFGAARALAGGGPDAVPPLVKALHHSDVRVRSVAAASLGQIRPPAKAAVPALIEALKDDDRDVRSSAAQGLGAIGTDAREALPALVSALRQKDRAVQQAAALALFRIDPVLAIKEDVKLPGGVVGAFVQGAAPALIQGLKKEGDPKLRARIAWFLGEFAATMDAVTAALKEATEDPDPDVRAAAAKALAKISNDP